MYLLLEELFQGGPLVLEPVVCQRCVHDSRALRQRRLTEDRTVDELIALYDVPGAELRLLHNDWADKWVSFVSGSGPEPPPISNEVRHRS